LASCIEDKATVWFPVENKNRQDLLDQYLNLLAGRTAGAVDVPLVRRREEQQMKLAINSSVQQ
jgi:hypothetical protein